MQSKSLRSKTVLAAAAGAAALSIVGTVTPAQAASSTYTVTIDTTDDMWGSPNLISFMLTADARVDGVRDFSEVMAPVRRDQLRINLNTGQKPYLWAMSGDGKRLSIVDLQGKRYVRIAGPVDNPDICGWKSFASRDAGNTGLKLNGNSSDACRW